MLRRAVMVVAVLVSVGLTRSAVVAQALNIVASGNTNLASIDMNDNGIPDETEDCNLSATANSDGSGLVVHGQQGSANLARPCSEGGDCNGSGFVSSGFAEVLLDGCDYAGGPFVPLVASFCDNPSSCQNPSTATGGVAGNGQPVEIRAGSIFRVLQEFRAGSGQLCSAGGPAVEITGEDGVTVLRNLFPYPSSGEPTHMCVNNVPVQVENSGDFVFKTACFPSSGGETTFSFGGDSSPFAVIRLVGLPGCGAVRGAPTTSEWGLMALMAGLLGLGVWALRQRDFGSDLPLP